MLSSFSSPEPTRKRQRRSTPRRQTAAAATPILTPGELELLDDLLFTSPPPKSATTATTPPQLVESSWASSPYLGSSSSSSPLAECFEKECATIVAPPVVELAPKVMERVLVALRAAYPDRTKFDVYFSDVLQVFVVCSPEHGMMGHHLTLRMDSADAKDVYLNSLQSGVQVRGRDMMEPLDAFARALGVRRVHLVDAATITLTGPDGRGFAGIKYSALSILATDKSYYNHFGYESQSGDAEEILAQNLALTKNQSFAASVVAVAATTKHERATAAAVVRFVDENSVGLFGGRTAEANTAHDIFHYVVMDSGGLKKPQLAEWIAATVQLFFRPDGTGIRVPRNVEKTSFEPAAVVTGSSGGRGNKLYRHGSGGSGRRRRRRQKKQQPTRPSSSTRKKRRRKGGIIL